MRYRANFLSASFIAIACLFLVSGMLCMPDIGDLKDDDGTVLLRIERGIVRCHCASYLSNQSDCGPCFAALLEDMGANEPARFDQFFRKYGGQCTQTADRLSCQAKLLSTVEAYPRHFFLSLNLGDEGRVTSLHNIQIIIGDI